MTQPSLPDRRRPEDDIARLEQWRAFVPTAQASLERRFGLDLDGSVRSLVPLWHAVIPTVTSPDREPADLQELPAWARWPEIANDWQVSVSTLHLIGEVAAYYGTVLADQFSPPRVNWEILRCRNENINVSGEGWLVLARPGRARNGLPHAWVCPQRDVLVAALAQLQEPLSPGGTVVGKNEPQRLATLVRLRIEEMG